VANIYIKVSTGGRVLFMSRSSAECSLPVLQGRLVLLQGWLHCCQAACFAALPLPMPMQLVEYCQHWCDMALYRLSECAAFQLQPCVSCVCITYALLVCRTCD
jgi:hypothetical protein